MLEPRHILIIEEDDEFRELAVEALQEGGYSRGEGYTIVQLPKLDIGLQVIERDKEFLAVICAWKNPDPVGNYPDFTGLDLLMRLRMHPDKELRNIPVIIHTADRRCEPQVVRAGRASVVSKFVTHTIPDALRILLKNP